MIPDGSGTIDGGCHEAWGRVFGGGAGHLDIDSLFGNRKGFRYLNHEGLAATGVLATRLGGVDENDHSAGGGDALDMAFHEDFASCEGGGVLHEGVDADGIGGLE